MERFLAGIGWFVILWFGSLMLGGMIAGSFASDPGMTFRRATRPVRPRARSSARASAARS
jgi:hypothetical protein